MELDMQIRALETLLIRGELLKYDIELPPRNIEPEYWQKNEDGDWCLTSLGRFDARKRLRSAKRERSAYILQLCSILLAAIASISAALQVYMAMN
ncbi:hypothetical protein CDZ97_07860 [Mameliella alba]|nr:hypothetical protein CDZ97_07860 [Mameliella alba]